MSFSRQELLEHIKQRSVMFGDFTLSSGAKSKYYIDCRMATLGSQTALNIGLVVCDSIKDLDFCGIGGLEVGSIPIITAVVVSLNNARYGKHMNCEGFWVRRAVKYRGTKKLIEGGYNLGPGSRVIIVDDVITSGESTMQAVTAARRVGFNVVAVVGLIDRMAGARKLFEENGIENYRPIFSLDDLGIPVD